MAQYTVKTGDSWAKIAGKVYGDQRMFLELAKANQGVYVLQAGMVLDLPPAYEDPFVSNEAAMAQGMAPSTAFDESGKLKEGWTQTPTGGYTNAPLTSALTAPTLGGAGATSPSGLTLPSGTVPGGAPTVPGGAPTGGAPIAPGNNRDYEQLELAKLETFKNYQTDPTRYTLPPRISDYTLQREYNPASIPEAMTSMGYQKVGTDWVLPSSLNIAGYVVPPRPYSSEWYHSIWAGMQVPPPYYYSPYAEVVQNGDYYSLVPYGQGGGGSEGGGGGRVTGSSGGYSDTGLSNMSGELLGLYTWRPGW